MEVTAAARWNLDTTLIFPEEHIMPRLFIPSLTRRYEELSQKNGVQFAKGVLIEKLEAGPDGRVATVVLKNGSIIEADTVIVGLGAKSVVRPFEVVGLNIEVGRIQVDSLFRTNEPGVFAVGDVSAFPLKIYYRMARVEHVDQARKSAQHCVGALSVSIFQPFNLLSTPEFSLVPYNFSGHLNPSEFQPPHNFSHASILRALSSPYLLMPRPQTINSFDPSFALSYQSATPFLFPHSSSHIHPIHLSHPLPLPSSLISLPSQFCTDPSLHRVRVFIFQSEAMSSSTMEG